MSCTAHELAMRCVPIIEYGMSRFLFRFEDKMNENMFSVKTTLGMSVIICYHVAI